MFLLVMKDNSNYRNVGYWDLALKLSQKIKNFKITGRGINHDIENKFLDLKNKSIENSGDLNLSEIENIDEMETLLLFDTKSVNCDIDLDNVRVIVYLTDHLRPGDERIQSYRERNLNFDQVNYVIHAFQYKSDLIKEFFPNAKLLHFPHWTTDKYDFEKSKIKEEKIYDYLLSGNSDPEYDWREKYRTILRGNIIFRNFIDNLKPPQLYSLPFKDFRKNSSEFSKLLMSSNFCLCDGGINGRVPGKMFEAMLSKSIVLMPDLGKSLTSIGVFDGVNAIVHSRDIDLNKIVELINFPEKYYDLEKIRQNAYNFAKNNHTTQKRGDLIKSIHLGENE